MKNEKKKSMQEYKVHVNLREREDMSWLNDNRYVQNFIRKFDTRVKNKQL